MWSVSTKSRYQPRLRHVHLFRAQRARGRVHTWNLDIEKEILADTVFRARYLGNHGSNSGITYATTRPRRATSGIRRRGQPLPTGTYSNVATRSYDQTTYGNLQEYRADGLDQQQRLPTRTGTPLRPRIRLPVVLHYDECADCRGSRVLRADSARSQPVPAGRRSHRRQTSELRFLNYQRDTGVPKHRVKWNWIADLPFGKGKWLGKDAGGRARQD